MALCYRFRYKADVRSLDRSTQSQIFMSNCGYVGRCHYLYIYDHYWIFSKFLLPVFQLRTSWRHWKVVCLLPSGSIVGLYFNKKRGKAVGIATSGVGVGTFVIPPLIEVVFNHYGFVGAFIIIGGITLNLTVFGILMRPLSAQRRIEAIQIRKKRTSDFCKCKDAGTSKAFKARRQFIR